MPIVEPEVLMDGDHASRAARRLPEVLQAYSRAVGHRIVLEGMVLKPNMVIAGKKARSRAPPEEVARRRCAGSNVMCRGRSQASPFCRAANPPRRPRSHLSLMNNLGALPWQLTFSYGRALAGRRVDRLGRAGAASGRTEGMVRLRVAEWPGYQRPLCREMESQAA